MVWVLLVLVLGLACAWVVGSSGRATPGRGLRVLWWLVGGRLACGPGGAGYLWCWDSSFFGSVVVGVAPAVVDGVDAVGGWAVVPVLPLSVVLVTLLVRAPPAELRVLAPPVMRMARAL